MLRNLFNGFEFEEGPCNQKNTFCPSERPRFNGSRALPAHLRLLQPGGVAGGGRDLARSTRKTLRKAGFVCHLLKTLCIKMVDLEPWKEIRRRISATIYGWDCPLLTFIYPGFDCGSNGGSGLFHISTHPHVHQSQKKNCQLKHPVSKEFEYPHILHVYQSNK